MNATCVLVFLVFSYKWFLYFVLFAAGIVQKHKFEGCVPIDQTSWGYRRNSAVANYMTTSQIIAQLVQTVRCCCIFL